jgi:hypothetical protein
MDYDRPSLSLDSVGSLENLIREIANYANLLGIAGKFHSITGTNWDKAAAESRQPFDFPNASEYFIDDPEFDSGFQSNAEFCRASQPIWGPGAMKADDVRREAAIASGCRDPFNITAASFPSGHWPIARARMYNPSNLSYERRLFVTVSPTQKSLRDRLADPELYLQPLKLQLDGKCYITLGIDNGSRLVETSPGGQTFQDACAGFGLACLCACHYHYPGQRSASDMCRAMACSPTMTFASASHHLLAGEEPWLYHNIRKLPWLSLPAHGSGVDEDIVDSATAATNDAIENPNRRAADEEFREDVQSFGILAIPDLGDAKNPERGENIRAAIVQNVKQKHPNTYIQFVRANGLPDPAFPDLSPLWTTATVFFPTPYPGATIERIVTTVSGTPSLVDPAILAKLSEPDPGSRITITDVTEPERNNSGEVSDNPPGRARPRHPRLRQLGSPDSGVSS